jgi:hypothetical protein
MITEQIADGREEENVNDENIWLTHNCNAKTT